MKTLKKILSAGLAVLTVMCSISLTAQAYDTVDIDKDRKSEWKTGVTNIIGDKVCVDVNDLKTEEGRKVKYNVELRGNTGYAASGVKLKFDPSLKLTPNPKEPMNPDKAWYKTGAGCGDLGKTAILNQEQGVWGFGTVGGENCADDGVYYTIEFNLPQDAKAGDTYPMELVVYDWSDERSVPVAYNVISGWIQVVDKAVASTTTASVTSTSATTTTVTCESSIAAKKPGDTNDDGAVTVSDAVLTARIIANDKKAELTEDGRRNADLDRSGTVDPHDLTLLLKALAESGKTEDIIKS